jgi:prepilin-type processing-associated H-X9-DG protein
MSISADKGPFFEASTERADKSVGDDYFGTFSGSTEIQLQTTDPTQILKLDNEKWRNYNSRNHSSEGQNVLFQDGHVEFLKKPIVGVNYDNIYTWHSGWLLQHTLLGNIPDDEKGPKRDTDSVIVP